MNEEKQKKVFAHLSLLRQMKEQSVSSAEALPACDEAMEVYGPMAEELGLHHEQREMLNLAVELGHPEDFQTLKRMLFDSEAMCEIVFKTFSLPICSMLDSLGLEYTFKYRMKSVYSIWRKMRVDHKEFDDVYDLFATRIVYKTPSQPLNLNAGNKVEQLPEVAQIKEQTFIINGLSKAYAMTGWRIGYCAGPRQEISAMVAFQSQATSNANSIAQHASAVALNGDQSCVTEMVKHFEERRNVMVERINAIPGISCLKPEGAFYVMMNIRNLIGKSYNGRRIESSMDFAELLLAEKQVAVVPRIAFEVHTCNTALQYVALNLGVAVLPHVPAMDDERISVIPLFENDREISRIVYLSWKKILLQRFFQD